MKFDPNNSLMKTILLFFISENLDFALDIDDDCTLSNSLRARDDTSLILWRLNSFHSEIEIDFVEMTKNARIRIEKD